MRARRPVAACAALACAGLVLVAPAATATVPLAVTAPAPVDDAVTLVGDTSAAVDVLANDGYAAPADVSAPARGRDGAAQHGVVSASTVEVDSSTRAALSYTPDAGWFGSDSFRYTVVDASGLAASASVSVTVTPVAPTANPDSAGVAPADSVRVGVLDNDTDPYAGRLTLTAVDAPAHGTALLESETALRYTPAVGWSGEETFGYTVTSSTGASATGLVTVTTLPSSPGHDALLSAPATILVLHSTTLTGAVSPVADAMPAVSVQTLGSAGWSSYADVVPDEAGSFTTAWTARTPGPVSWRALAIWPDGTQATSPVVVTDVVASADPVVSGPLSRRDVPYSYRSGCPVPSTALRRLTINFWDYSGQVRRGSVILLASAVPAVRSVFTTAFAARFSVKSMIPVDAYYRGGTVSPTTSDIRSMNAGNTSAYNCRKVTGSRYRMSQHSYGDAIDVNTFENPYGTASRIYPVAAAQRYYVMRRYHLGDRGVIAPRSVLATAFASKRWLWGARWTYKDYQHFSANGG